MILGDEAMCICSFLQHRPEKPPLDCSTRYAGETRTLSNYVFLYLVRWSLLGMEKFCHARWSGREWVMVCSLIVDTMVNVRES